MRIFPKGRRPEGYIPINLRTQAGGISLIHQLDMFIFIYYFDEVYIRDIPPAVSIAT